MIDTHCHLDLAIFDADRDLVLQRSRQAGIATWIVPGVVLSGFSRMTTLSTPGMYWALGLHPMYCADHPQDGVRQLASWIDRSTPIAIGEIGLDHLAPVTTHIEQRVLFEEQLKLAQYYHLPVLLHARKTHDLVLTILRRIPLPRGGIVHAFNGSLQQANQYRDLGFKLGFGGVMTYERSRHIRQVASQVAEEVLVLETDAPDLPPAGHAHERNEPAHLQQIAQTLAQLRQTSLAHIIHTTTHNAKNVFNL